MITGNTGNPFPFSDDNKRYHTLRYDNARRGVLSYKAVLDAGFTCPNIDGTKGTGGCIYCDGGSGYFSAAPTVPIRDQLKSELARIRKKKPDAQAVAYFQAHTNTYAPVERLQALFEPVLREEGVCGLSVATRADALNEDVLTYLEDLNRRTRLTVELGLQTVFDRTARLINRCHSYAEFLQGYAALKERSIRVCVHLINGLPGETAMHMLKTAEKTGQLKPDAVKLHLLHVIRGTPLEELYLRGGYEPMTLEDYVNVVAAQLELLPPETVIERVTGDADRRTLTAPLWSKDKLRVLGSLDKVLALRNTFQGKRYISGVID